MTVGLLPGEASSKLYQQGALCPAHLFQRLHPGKAAWWGGVTLLGLLQRLWSGSRSHFLSPPRLCSCHWDVPPCPQLHPEPWGWLLVSVCGGPWDWPCVSSLAILVWGRLGLREATPKILCPWLPTSPLCPERDSHAWKPVVHHVHCLQCFHPAVALLGDRIPERGS
jgi:hypothetical protein